MARKNAGNKAGNTWSDAVFANVSLRSEDKQQIASLVANGQIEVFELLDCVHEGMRLTVSRDRRNNAFVASLSCRVDEGEGKTVILTGRGSDALNALCALHYKHFTLTDGLWPDQGMPMDDNGDFG